MSEGSERERGHKWWLRYVIVPLIGGGGIVAIVVAILSNLNFITPPTSTPERPAAASLSEIEQELSTANITLSESGPERVKQVREWLRNDAAYQALAQMCLTVLADKRIIGNPVPLEVINGRYKGELGYTSDKYVPADEYSDKHFDELRIAIFKTWKERNTGPQSSFDEIVVSR